MAQYATDTDAKMALDQTYGNMLVSGAMDLNAISTGVAYAGSTAVYEKQASGASYELAYTNISKITGNKK